MDAANRCNLAPHGSACRCRIQRQLKCDRWRQSAGRADQAQGLTCHHLPEATAPVATTASPNRHRHRSDRTYPEPDPVEKLVGRAKAWLLGGNTVARVGTVVLFIGLSFLAKWAADNALFPPELRLAAVGIVGIALLVQGFRLSRRVAVGDNGDEIAARRQLRLPASGRWRSGALTIFAAFKLYAMIPALAAFVLMALVCALSTLLALLADKQMLAFVGFAGAFATPILVSTGSGSHVACSVTTCCSIWPLASSPGYGRGGRSTCSASLQHSGWRRCGVHWVCAGELRRHAAVPDCLLRHLCADRFVYALRHAGDGKRVLDGIVIFGTPIVSFLLQTQLVEHFEYGAADSAGCRQCGLSAAGAVCAQPGDHSRRRRRSG